MKLTKIEQIEKINLQENNLYYIYGKTGSGKTYFVKQLIGKDNKKALYTNVQDFLLLHSQNNAVEEDIIVLDGELSSILEKELTCMTFQRILDDLIKSGKKIIIISNLEPQELEKKKEELAKYLLSEMQIEVAYDIESRIKIAEKYSKELEMEIAHNILSSIAKETNLGKIRGQINQIKMVS